MEQPILTDAEVNRLNEIRRTHKYPAKHTDRDSPATLLGTLKIRNKQRGELLDMVDKLLAGVTGSDLAWQHAHNLAAQCDRLIADNAKLKNDIGELRLRNNSLIADIEGMNRAQCNMQADLSNALKKLAQANGRDATIKFYNTSNYAIEVEPERNILDPQFPVSGRVSYVPAKVMNLGELIRRYNTIAALTSKG